MKDKFIEALLEFVFFDSLKEVNGAFEYFLFDLIVSACLLYRSES